MAATTSSFPEDTGHSKKIKIFVEEIKRAVNINMSLAGN